MVSYTLSSPINGNHNLCKDGTQDGLAEQIHRHAQARPQNLAVEFEGNGLTFAELHCQALALARQLIQQGLELEQAVGVITDAGIDQIIAQVAIISALLNALPSSTRQKYSKSPSPAYRIQNI